MNPYHHALSSVARFGGVAEDYLTLHQWFDESKAFFPDFRHRALRHHAEGIFLAERVFGVTITNQAGRVIPTRFLGEQHVKEDLGRIPTVQDWLTCLKPEPWMMRAGKLLDSKIEKKKPCVCEQPGHFYAGVPGVLAHLEDGRLAAGTTVERCDLCCRFPSDEAALSHIRELSLA